MYNDVKIGKHLILLRRIFICSILQIQITPNKSVSKIFNTELIQDWSQEQSYVRDYDIEHLMILHIWVILALA